VKKTHSLSQSEINKFRYLGLESVNGNNVTIFTDLNNIALSACIYATYNQAYIVYI
jgi:hypothetical protein